MAKAIEWEYAQFKSPQFVPQVPGVPVLGKAKFKILGEKLEDGTDDFQDALHDVKKCIPWNQRQWVPDESRWHVWVSIEVRKLLCDVFRNVEGLFEEVENQLELFEFLESETS